MSNCEESHLGQIHGGLEEGKSPPECTSTNFRHFSVVRAHRMVLGWSVRVYFPSGNVPTDLIIVVIDTEAVRM
jgi:hypothetical protein